MEQITPAEKEQTTAIIDARKRYFLFAIIAFFFIALAFVLIIVYPDSIMSNPIIDIQGPETPKNNVDAIHSNVNNDAGNIDNNIAGNIANNDVGIIAIFNGDAPVPTELNMTRNEYIDNYLYGCYFIESDNEKIDCYGLYYFNTDNPVKEQRDMCNQESIQDKECMDMVYTELAAYIGRVGCYRISDESTKQSCIERAE